VRGPYVAWRAHLHEEKRNMIENNEQLSDLRTSMGSEPITTCMKYYDLKKNRHRVKPHLADKRLNDILVKDFNKFTFGESFELAFEEELKPGKYLRVYFAEDHSVRRTA
jgi:hypothetical protein